ncbi:MAG: hypothetical protein HY917_00590, partial [Candidatus Diapherotrites archaeon]|nr:hypothetical protein [Candidatus Diapherotrites archaeon]
MPIQLDQRRTRAIQVFGIMFFLMGLAVVYLYLFSPTISLTEETTPAGKTYF